MQYLQAKATATPTTDRGEFQAIVATYDRDREGDRIQPGAFAASIMEWRSVGRRLPLHWNHITDQIIGDVDPAEMWEDDDQGLEVNRRIDLDTEQGQAVWKSLKQNRLGFSFGYAVKRERKRRDGGRDLLELDVYEISVTPSPMNNQTRVLSTKSLGDLPPELVGTAWDPMVATGGAEPWTESLLSERKAAQDRWKAGLRQQIEAKAAEMEAAEAEAEREKAEAEARMANPYAGLRELGIPWVEGSPPTRLVFDGSTYQAVDARDPDDRSPGLDAASRPLPSRNELKAIAREKERRARENAKGEEERRAQCEASRPQREAQQRREAERVLAEKTKRQQEIQRRRAVEQRERAALIAARARYEKTATLNVGAFKVHPNGEIVQ